MMVRVKKVMAMATADEHDGGMVAMMSKMVMGFFNSGEVHQYLSLSAVMPGLRKSSLCGH